MARIFRWMVEILPTDVLDDGPQLLVGASLGSIFGAWVTASGAGHSIDWLRGWPLIFLAAIPASLSLWVWRGRHTDRAKKRKEAREAASHAANLEARDAAVETRDMMRVLLKTTSASGIAAAATPGFVAANVTAKASVSFGEMKIEAKGEIPEKEDDSGA